MKEHTAIHRGDVFYADLEPVVGSEQGGTRPVVIIQNEVGNRFSPTVIVAAVTTTRSKLPTHVALDEHIPGLRKDSVILLEQLRTLDKLRLKQYIGKLSPKTLQTLNTALGISIGLENNNGAHPNGTVAAMNKAERNKATDRMKIKVNGKKINLIFQREPNISAAGVIKRP